MYNKLLRVFTKRDSYYDELPINNKTLVIYNNPKLLKNNKKIPRENEFLRDFCIWRKAQGQYVPITWEK